jgi:hypothetical protein
LKEMADAQAAPLLDKLRSEPNNPDLLTSIGNILRRAAVSHRSRLLWARPQGQAFRRSRAHRYGDGLLVHGERRRGDCGIQQGAQLRPHESEYAFQPWPGQVAGEEGCAGAIADWEKLLAANPNYEGKDKVEQMMAEVKQHSADCQVS